MELGIGDGCASDVEMPHGDDGNMTRRFIAQLSGVFGDFGIVIGYAIAVMIDMIFGRFAGE